MLVILPIDCDLLLPNFIPCLIGPWYDLNICLITIVTAASGGNKDY